MCIRDRTVADVQLDAAGNAKIVISHEVIHLVDRAVRAVFNGQDAVLAKPLFHGVEHAGKIFEIHDIGEGKRLVARLLGVRPLHTLTGHDGIGGENLPRVAERILNIVCQCRRVLN